MNDEEPKREEGGDPDEDGETGAEGGNPVPSSRRSLEILGLAGVAALTIVTLTFLMVDWLSGLPVFASLYEGFLLAGSWADHLLGTSLFGYPSILRQVSTGLLVGVSAPLVGVFVVHKQMALIGETLAHTAFAGVALGLIATAFVSVGFVQDSAILLFVALLVSVAGALGLQVLTEKSRGYGDVPIAIVLSGSFAVGTLIISYGRDRMALAIDVEGFLFGSLAIVTAEGARMMAVLTVAVVALVTYNYKQLFFVTFDEQAAKVAGFDVRWYNSLLIVLTAVVVVGAMQILGVILVAAMIVVPVAAASQVSKSFRETVYLSVIVGQVSVVGGLAFAVSYSLPPGGSIVVVAIAFYLLAVATARYS